MDDRKDKLGKTIKDLFASMNDSKVAQDGCLSDEQLASYIDGNLPSDELVKIETHLAECMECTDKVVLLSDIIGSFSESSKSLITEKMVEDAKKVVQPSVNQNHDAKVTQMHEELYSQKIESPQSQILYQTAEEDTCSESVTDRKTKSFWTKIASFLPSTSPAPIAAFATLFLAVMIYGIFHMQSSKELAPVQSSKELAPEIKAISPFVQFNVYKVLPTRGTSSTLVEVPDGGLMQSEDTFQINVKLQEKAYLYILLLDSRGILSKLYPEGTSLHKELNPDEVYTIPKNNKWILDNNEGQEILFLLTSKMPIQNLDKEIELTKNIDNLHKKFPQANVEKFEFTHRGKSE